MSGLHGAPHTPLLGEEHNVTTSTTGDQDDEQREREVRRVRAVRVEDDLWEDAHEAARWRGEQVSAVVRQLLRKYVQDTERRKRNGERGRG